MLGHILFYVGLAAALGGCAAFGNGDYEDGAAMIPPSANYAASPVQAPIYPPLVQDYSQNILPDVNGGRTMSVDRLNVGEANFPTSPYVPQGGGYASNTQVASPYAQPAPLPAPIPSSPYTQGQAGQNYYGTVAPLEFVPYESVQVEKDALSAKKEKEDAAAKAAEEAAPNIIPNSPMLTPSNIIELSAVGMGVAPESTISPSQALALAKRAAIIDAYRQIGEKMYGIKLNAQDTVKDMVLINSIVKTRVEALIKNAEIIETVYKDGLCQITMELKLDGRVWHKILSNS